MPQAFINSKDEVILAASSLYLLASLVPLTNSKFHSCNFVKSAIPPLAKALSKFNVEADLS